MRTFSEAALSPCSDCYSKEFVLDFSKFYYHQCFEDLSSKFKKIKTSLKLKTDKADEDIKFIRNCFKAKTTSVKEDVFRDQKEMVLKSQKDTPMYECGHEATYLTASLFMPFVFFFNKEKQEKKLVHWPVAGPTDFNCRIIKHDIVEDLNKKIMTEDLCSSSHEMSFVVPFKIECSSEASEDAGSTKMSSLFSDVRLEKPEYKNMRAIHLELDDFGPLYRIFYVSVVIIISCYKRVSHSN